MIIGIPKEIMHGERRVAGTPETVAKFVKDGAKVLVEKGAGVGAFFADDAYAAAGAEMVADVASINYYGFCIFRSFEIVYVACSGFW